MTRFLLSAAVVACIVTQTSELIAGELEKKGTSISKALKTDKVFKRAVAPVNGQELEVYYSKGADGKSARYAVTTPANKAIIYPPDCTHTWVVGIDAKTKTVDDVRVVEMSCPHALPTSKASFLDQYKGTNAKNLKDLKGKVHTIAKATGSSDLTTAFVTTAVTAVSQLD